MSSIFGIDLSALQAFQQAIEVTSNNVANASTPGYDEETIELNAAAPQTIGGIPIGAGVDVTARHGDREALVRSAWIIRQDEEFPRLVSCYVL